MYREWEGYKETRICEKRKTAPQQFVMQAFHYAESFKVNNCFPQTIIILRGGVVICYCRAGVPKEGGRSEEEKKGRQKKKNKQEME